MLNPPFFMRSILMMLISLWFISCGNNGDNKNDIAGETVHGNAKDTIVTGAKPVIVAGCYQMAIKKDTAFLELAISDSIVTGALDYKWNQKDNNKGTINGVIRDSLIVADYNFQSEGVMSVREVIFKIYPGKLIQASGEIEEHNTKQVFKDLHHLQYDTLLSFYKALCR